MSFHPSHGLLVVAVGLFCVGGCATETTETQRPVMDDEAAPAEVQERHTGVDEPQTGAGDAGAIDQTQSAADPRANNEVPTPSESETVDEVE